MVAWKDKNAKGLSHDDDDAVVVEYLQIVS